MIEPGKRYEYKDDRAMNKKSIYTPVRTHRDHRKVSAGMSRSFYTMKLKASSPNLPSHSQFKSSKNKYLSVHSPLCAPASAVNVTDDRSDPAPSRTGLCVFICPMTSKKM